MSGGRKKGRVWHACQPYPLLRLAANDVGGRPEDHCLALRQVRGGDNVPPGVVGTPDLEPLAVREPLSQCRLCGVGKDLRRDLRRGAYVGLMKGRTIRVVMDR